MKLNDNQVALLTQKEYEYILEISVKLFFVNGVMV